MAPTVRRGFSEANGSWNTICTRSLMCRTALPRAPVTSRPSSVIRPDAVGTSWTMARASVDLPDPDSPTMPIEVPASTARLTSSTAVSACRPAPYLTATWSSSSRLTGLPPQWSRR